MKVSKDMLKQGVEAATEVFATNHSKEALAQIQGSKVPIFL
jgi:hypothetical protein